MKSREILTYPITTAQINDELRFFVDYLLSRGLLDCDVLFGSAWGIDYYESSDWEYERLPLADLVQKVNDVAELDWGGLGQNDLWIRIPGSDVEFQFCNDSDVHIWFYEPGEVTEFFYRRWDAQGFTPREYYHTNDATDNAT